MTKRIMMADGSFALVDDDWYEDLNQYSWFNHNGYAVASVNGKNTRMHRFILDAPDYMQVDHINGKRSDNRTINLRLCTGFQNARNVGLRKDNSSGYKGVWRAKRAGQDKWEANIRYRGKRFYLGLYNTPEDAARAYDDAAKRYHRGFAKLNFPED